MGLLKSQNKPTTALFLFPNSVKHSVDNEKVYSLKWNDFTSNVKDSFQNLRNEEDFFDITLVGDDYKHVTDHKLVLSSCSEYFKNVFSNNKKHFQSHAMICLEGLNHGDLNNILDYIYQGERGSVAPTRIE